MGHNCVLKLRQSPVGFWQIKSFPELYAMSVKRIVLLVFFLAWMNIGVFYALYHLQVENLFIGVLRELTIIPSIFVGVVSPLIYLILWLNGRNKAKDWDLFYLNQSASFFITAMKERMIWLNIDFCLLRSTVAVVFDFSIWFLINKLPVADKKDRLWPLAP